MNFKANGVSCTSILKATAVTLIILLSCAFILCAYEINEGHVKETTAQVPRIIAIEDENGSTVLLSVDNSLRVDLGESGIVSDIMLSSNGDRAFYIVRNTEGSFLCTRTLSALINDRYVIGEGAVSYLLSKTNRRAVYLTEEGSLFYAKDGAFSVKVSDKVGQYYFSDDGGTLIYSAKSESGIQCIYSYNGKTSALLYENADIVKASEDLSYLLLSSGSSLIRFDVKSSSYSILSDSFEDLEAIIGDAVYFSFTNEDGASSLFCFDGQQTLVTDKLHSVELASDTVIVYSEQTDGEYEKIYKVITSRKERSEAVLSGSELHGFIYSAKASALYYNDASGEQEMLIKATVADGKITKFSVVDTDTQHVCGIVSGKIVYLKNFNPISNTADLYCNSERIRSGVAINEISSLPDYNPSVRTYTWVHRGIVTTGYACLEIPGADALAYTADGKIYTFDGKYERVISVGELKNILPISSATVAIRADGALTVSVGGKIKDKKITVKRFISVSAYSK